MRYAADYTLDREGEELPVELSALIYPASRAPGERDLYVDDFQARGPGGVLVELSPTEAARAESFLINHWSEHA